MQYLIPFYGQIVFHCIVWVSVCVSLSISVYLSHIVFIHTSVVDIWLVVHFGYYE